MKTNNGRQRQILCGGCRKPLVRSTSNHIVDLVGETYAERVGLQCDNELCGYNTRVIEEVREDRPSWWSRVVRWLRVGSATLETHYECPTCGSAVPFGMACHHNL